MKPSETELLQKCGMSANTSVALEADIQSVIAKLQGLKGDLAVQLTSVSEQSFLPKDFTVPAGARVFLDGGGRTMTLGGKQFDVKERATFCLFNIFLTSSSVRMICLSVLTCNDIMCPF